MEHVSVDTGLGAVLPEGDQGGEGGGGLYLKAAGD